MDAAEIIQKYYERHGLVRLDEAGSSDRIAVVPYVIGDVIYTFWCRFIYRYDAVYNEKRAQNLLGENLRAFLKELSDCYTPDEYEWFTDMMDRLNELLKKDLFIMHIQAQNCFVTNRNRKGETVDFTIAEQKVVGAALVANTLAVEAQEIYTQTRYNQSLKKYISSRRLDGVIGWSRAFFVAFLNRRGIDAHASEVTERQYSMMKQSSQIVLNKIHKWIMEEMV